MDNKNRVRRHGNRGSPEGTTHKTKNIHKNQT